MHATHSSSQEKEPWLNGSRIKLILIWLPFQLVSISIVTYLAAHTFKHPRESVSLHNTSLLYVGMLLAEYFIFVSFKDLFIMISQLFFGGFLGFWHGIILHVVTTPLDMIVLSVLSVWGSAVLN